MGDREGLLPVPFIHEKTVPWGGGMCCKVRAVPDPRPQAGQTDGCTFDLRDFGLWAC